MPGTCHQVSGTWRGELLAYPISSAGLGAPQWRAGEHVAAWGSRKIYTVGSSGGSTFPTADQLATLSTEATALGLPSGTALANYLKGDSSLEKRNGGALRDRTMRNSADQVIAALIGDICHHPLQVFYPEWNSAFCEDQDAARATRKRVLGSVASDGGLLMPAHFGAPHAVRVKAKGDRFEIPF